MSLPSKTSFKTTSFGVRARELVISGAAGFLGLATLALPLGSIFVRILIAAGLSGAGVTYAFWRVGRVWTIEGYLASRLKFDRRSRRFLKGGASATGVSGPAGGRPAAERVSAGRETPAPAAAEATAAAETAVGAEALDPPAPLFWLLERLSPSSNAELVGMVASTLAVIAFLAWIGTTGGVGAIQGQLQVVWLAVWNR